MTVCILGIVGHPIMFDDADPLLARLREICLSFPDAAEKISHGRPNWYTTKVFAIYGGSVKGDHDDPTLRRALLFLPDPDEMRALEQDGRFLIPAYLGVGGWRALPLDRSQRVGGEGDGGEENGGEENGGEVNGGEVNWNEVAELVESSYRQLAGVRRVARLDAERDGRRG